MSGHPRLTSLSYQCFYYQSSLLLGGPLTRVNELHRPQYARYPQLASPFGWYPELPSGGRSRTLSLCHSVDVLVLYGAHLYLYPVTMSTPLPPMLNVNFSVKKTSRQLIIFMPTVPMVGVGCTCLPEIGRCNP